MNTSKNTSQITLDGDGVLTTAEVATLLGLSKFTLLRMRQQKDRGDLPYLQLSPGRLAYWKSDVRAYIAARRVSGMQPADKSAA
jgi:predicted DNA-binding transcriptional regulator AlpA